MKTLNTIQKLSKVGKVLSRIAFVFAVIGFCGCIMGLISVQWGNGSVIQWGGVTLHGILSRSDAYDLKSITAALSGILFVCAGEAMLAWFAVRYFQNELKAGTPFTLSGAKELLRLGILTCAVPLGSAMAASITEGIVSGYLRAARDSYSDIFFNNDGSVALGVMFIFMSLLCRYGAEQKAD